MTTETNTKVSTMEKYLSAEINRIFSEERDDIEIKCLEQSVLKNLGYKKTITFVSRFNKIIDNTKVFGKINTLDNVFVRKIGAYTITYNTDGILDKFKDRVYREDILSLVKKIVTKETDFLELIDEVCQKLNVTDHTSEVADMIEEIFDIELVDYTCHDYEGTISFSPPPTKRAPAKVKVKGKKSK